MLDNDVALKKLIKDSLRILKFRNCIYLNNPKAACSTVKIRLVNIENQFGNTDLKINNGKELHNTNLPIFSFSIEDFIRAKKFIFTFVRNPFARILSTYLDKMQKNVPERRYFCQLCGIHNDTQFSFLFFLRNICKFSDILDDPHWRCQSANILHDLMPINFIGSVETFEEDFKYLSKKCFKNSAEDLSWKKHSTAASGKLREYITEEAASMIIKKYYWDFYNFNYSFDFSQQTPLAHPSPTEENRISMLRIKKTLVNL